MFIDYVLYYKKEQNINNFILLVQVTLNVSTNITL